MTPRRFESWLKNAIDLAWDDERDEPGAARIRRVETFEEAGIMTTDAGLLVLFEDGSEIQVTLVCSKRARNDRGHDRMRGEPDEDDE